MQHNPSGRAVRLQICQGLICAHAAMFSFAGAIFFFGGDSKNSKIVDFQHSTNFWISLLLERCLFDKKIHHTTMVTQPFELIFSSMT